MNDTSTPPKPSSTAIATIDVEPRPTTDLAVLADQINDEYAACQAAGQDMAEHAAKCGQLLLKAKDEVPHGQWGDWLKKNFAGRKQRTAQVYMSVARTADRKRALGKTQHAAFLSLREVLDEIARERANERFNRRERQLAKRRAAIESASPSTAAPTSTITNTVAEHTVGRPKPKFKATKQGAALKSDTTVVKTDDADDYDIPSSTCPQGGRHEPDEDGDCAKCKEPGVDKLMAGNVEQPEPEVVEEIATSDVGHVDEQEPVANDMPAFSLPVARARLENAVTGELVNWPDDQKLAAADALERLAREIRQDAKHAADQPGEANQ
jgi:hypothetical protein